MRLIALHYSPWSEQARWALEHHRLPYTYTEYLPMLGEPLLRIASRKPWRKPTVPMLIDGSTVLHDSLEIARLADARGSAPSLFPDSTRVEAINHTAERLKASGRALSIDATLRNSRALEESLPPFFPEHLRGALRPLARLGAHFLARKHRARTIDTADHLRILADGLRELRDTLDGQPFFLDTFSYADIVVATTLQFVLPPGNAFCSLGPAVRDCWTKPELASELSDLLAWRDQLYRNHRLRPESHV